MACIGQAASLKSRVPFLHFFDGFRTSHEINRIEELLDEDLRYLMDPDMIRAHRRRALSPDHPVIRGTAQNPDTFFQAREACNQAYDLCPDLVQETMDRFSEKVGRPYHLFDYHGHPRAERIVILMGSGAETTHETIDHLMARGEKVGMIKVRLYRPFAKRAFIEAIPSSVKSIAVLDRTKEPGSLGDPLYLDVVTALREAEDEGLSQFAQRPALVGGRYGLSSKEFTPGMVKSVLNNLSLDTPRNHFTVGIIDDVTHLALPWDASFEVPHPGVMRAVFYGLGSDGTVGSNKNSIKIIGEETGQNAQGFFVYDSKKSGAMTVSHLRFGGSQPIRATYLIPSADFVACHQPIFLDKIDVLRQIKPGGTFLLNTSHGPDTIWDTLPREVQEEILNKRLKFHVIDAFAIAAEVQLGRYISAIMQTSFFLLTKVLPRDEAILKIKEAIEKAYAKAGAVIVARNKEAVDKTLTRISQVTLPESANSDWHRLPMVPLEAPDHVKNVSAIMMSNHGDSLPVSAFPVDGTWPTGTSRWEKRNIAQSIPIWDPKVCIQCNKCAFVCPHAAIRATVFAPSQLAEAPSTFQSVPFKAKEWLGSQYSIQVAPEDCTGCKLCVEVCPAKDKANPRHKAINMEPHADHVVAERDNYRFFSALPIPDRDNVRRDVKGSQFLEPLFEYSGACAGCGETPYIKLLTQLVGDRLMIANATGCSSIFGGNLPTTPYTTNQEGRGPAWSNSLFEDNAEFGFGFRLAVDAHRRQAEQLLRELGSDLGDTLVSALLDADQAHEGGIRQQRERVQQLKERLTTLKVPEARRLEPLADYLVEKSVWLVGGDGWAYDIGYGGLDHVLASTRNINVLVLDTEVYSNTGGQASKATPLGAAAKFATAGKETGKKDLGLLAMTYGHIYVARVAFGAKDAQTIKAFREAEAYPGPSLIIAYSHCIAHGFDLSKGANQQKLAVESGVWPLYRFDPRRLIRGLAPLQMDSGAPTIKARDYMRNESRFSRVEKSDPKRFARLLKAADALTAQRYQIYGQLADLKLDTDKPKPPTS